MGFSQFADQSKFKKNLIIISPVILGYLFGTSELSIRNLFFLAILSLAFLLLISWVRLWETPETTVMPLFTGILVLLAAPLFILWVMFDHVLCTGIITLVLAFVFYADFINFKSRAVLSTVTFFVMVVIIFAAGYGAAAGINPNAFIFGIFFGLLFAAGQLAGEIIDFNFDQAMNNNSNAHAFGLEKISGFSKTLFFIATGYLLVLMISAMVNPAGGLPFLIALFLLGIILYKMKNIADPQNALVFQTAYRALFALASLTFFIVKL